MSLILNSENIYKLCTTRSLVISRKPQKIKGNYNFSISPLLCLRIYNVKVLISDTKYIVLEFDKIENGSLFMLLLKIDKHITEYLKNIFNFPDNITFHSIYSDVDTKFTLRCYLPQTNNKYNIKYYVDNQEETFQCLHKNSVLKEVIIDVKNIWQNKDRVGYNLELKKVYLE